MKATLCKTFLVLMLAAGCSPAPTQDPQLLLSVRPTSAKDDGTEVDVQATATDAFGKAGKGDVVLTAEHGVFGNGQASITITLDTAGNAFTTFSCDGRKDFGCFGPVMLDAVWAGVKTGVGTATTDVTTNRRVNVTGCGFPQDAGTPPVRKRCAPATVNECDGPTDTFNTSVGVNVPNATGGNSYDDDCDGFVDEGCACAAKGITKECWLVPPSMKTAATGNPAGWCAFNSVGSVDCAGLGSPQWSGQCRGASPPADHDSCSAGDFNCDGLERNNDQQGCRCAVDLNCPTTPLRLAPFPNPRALTGITGANWLPDAGLAQQTTNWRWTAIGGDCDNVLPNPTFALYRGRDTTVAGARVGTKTTVVYDTSFDPPRYLEDSTSTVRAVRATSGDGFAGATIFPAFSLSGDYVVQGEFDLGPVRYACTQKVEVRAPGVRAELCWDTVGNNDVDLHFARLQDTACTVNGWNSLCAADGGQDCYYANSGPNWGYADSADSACQGWGSKQNGPCTNPRLDVDNISCNTTVEDPVGGGFCSPENTNVDAPRDGDTFAVGVVYFGSSATTKLAHPHVNLYCNGARVLSTGYNPVTGQTFFPALRTTGGGNGDFWSVATITARVDGGALVGCDVQTLPSRFADPTRDGLPVDDAGTDYCIDSPQNQTPAPNNYNLQGGAFIQNKKDGGQVGDAGAIPSFREDWCRH
jgi:hypothetical protein